MSLFDWVEMVLAAFAAIFLLFIFIVVVVSWIDDLFQTRKVRRRDERERAKWIGAAEHRIAKLERFSMEASSWFEKHGPLPTAPKPTKKTK
jgi:UDP-N-acetylmuramyl pentapeptide phosphotransferase/UDP-N-acetylglucosamine-1-phosphate transferase